MRPRLYFAGCRSDVLVDEHLLGDGLRFSNDLGDSPQSSRGVVVALVRSLVEARQRRWRGVLEGGFLGLVRGTTGITGARGEFLYGRLLRWCRNDGLVFVRLLGVTWPRVSSVVRCLQLRRSSFSALGRDVLDACRRTQPALLDGAVSAPKLSRKLWIHERKLGTRERGVDQKIRRDSHLTAQAGRERCKRRDGWYGLGTAFGSVDSDEARSPP